MKCRDGYVFLMITIYPKKDFNCYDVIVFLVLKCNPGILFIRFIYFSTELTQFRTIRTNHVLAEMYRLHVP